jgi:hypothetical protein
MKISDDRSGGVFALQLESEDVPGENKKMIKLISEEAIGLQGLQISLETTEPGLFNSQVLIPSEFNGETYFNQKGKLILSWIDPLGRIEIIPGEPIFSFVLEGEIESYSIPIRLNSQFNSEV